MRIDLQIGGYAIRLHEREARPCLHWPLRPFDSFLIQPERPSDIDLEVKIVKDLPEVPHGPLIFDASHGLWKLYAAESGYLFESPDTYTLRPRSRAIVSADFSHAEVWHCEQPSHAGPGWTPMHIVTPIVEVCLVTRLARDGGLLLHAAGTLTDHGGWVFTGPSGSGKSTLCDLFTAGSARVLCDERIILRKVAGALVVYGTPWAGAGQQATNAAGPLTALYCIRHGEGTHALRKLSHRDFSLFVLRQCFLPHWDRAAMDRTLTFLDELIDRIGCFELAFVKRPDVVDYLEEQRVGHAVASS
ncbi:MAG TPA: hypothetical protein VJM82_03270 [Nitrospiraceae bacterium]|nr:hypothetical protein [Nitrospiraceae bacterium]